MSVVGAKRLLKYKRLAASKKKPKATGAYKVRNAGLPSLGYVSYAEYLQSPEWKAIRDKVMRKWKGCCVCDGAATQLHHWDYSDVVMLGLCAEYLLPICDACHQAAEFDGDRKRPLPEVQDHLRKVILPVFFKRLNGGHRRMKWIRKHGGLTSTHPLSSHYVGLRGAGG